MNIFPNPKGTFLCCVDSNLYRHVTENQYDVITMVVAGLAAEEIEFGEYSACSTTDIQNATLISLDSVNKNII